jgi:hypothetical protein
MAKDTLDEALEPFEVETVLYDLAVKEWASTEAQASDFSKLHRAEFKKGADGKVIHIELGLPADHPDVAALIAAQYPHLVPAAFEVPLADRAFLENNLGARGALVKQIGPAAALELAKRYGLDSLGSTKKGVRPENLPPEKEPPNVGAAGDHKNNPFSKQGWNISAQGSLLRAVGPVKCAQIAASVGCTIGATRPNPNF